MRRRRRRRRWYGGVATNQRDDNATTTRYSTFVCECVCVNACAQIIRIVRKIAIGSPAFINTQALTKHTHTHGRLSPHKIRSRNRIVCHIFVLVSHMRAHTHTRTQRTNHARTHARQTHRHVGPGTGFTIICSF